MDTRQKVQKFINEELLNGETPVGVEDDLLSDGMIDSLSIVRLIGYIEENFNIQIPPEDLVIEHFQTIQAIDAYLKSRGLG